LCKPITGVIGEQFGAMWVKGRPSTVFNFGSAVPHLAAVAVAPPKCPAVCQKQPLPPAPFERERDNIV